MLRNLLMPKHPKSSNSKNLFVLSIISVCLKRAVIRNASILLALKNKGLAHKLEAYITVYGQTLIIKRSKISRTVAVFALLSFQIYFFNLKLI